MQPSQPTQENSNSQQNIPQPVATQQPNDYAMNQFFMPTDNKYAIKAYYYGFFSLIPFVGFPFIFLTFPQAKKAKALYITNPTPSAKGHYVTGVVLAIISAVLWVLALLLTVIIIIGNNADNQANF
jgi:hypothetical protein